mmetsp:Transcript_12662/g.29394  ORF Transcript_12662/g.29394 Transcript_12662/m.29394 type:complete len:101 (-) Transcript_12662:319-621(-)
MRHHTEAGARRLGDQNRRAMGHEKRHQDNTSTLPRRKIHKKTGARQPPTATWGGPGAKATCNNPFAGLRLETTPQRSKRPPTSLRRVVFDGSVAVDLDLH